MENVCACVCHSVCITVHGHFRVKTLDAKVVHLTELLCSTVIFMKMQSSFISEMIFFLNIQRWYCTLGISVSESSPFRYSGWVSLHL